VTLLAFATERRAAVRSAVCGDVVARRLPLSIDISWPRGAQQQTRRTLLQWSIDGTDRRADYAGSVSKRICRIMSSHSGWRRGVVVSGVRRMNEVNARRARLAPGWVTVFGRVYHLGM